MKLGLIVFAIFLLSTGEILAQSDLATLTGTVRDVSGAVIAGAQMAVINLSNNLQSSAATNAVGVYTFLDLPVGQYRLTCAKAGFAGYERSGINLAISQVAEIDIVLRITASGSAVVTADAPLLETQTSSLSTNLSNPAITELPLNVQGGRNLSAFMFAYVPGVEGGGSTATSMDFDSHINGSLASTKEVIIDGTSAVSQIGGYLSESSPPMEAVQEFQVTSAGIRADDGRTGGGVFRYEMKSGTNAWHGSGFYYMHNEALDARSFSDKYNDGLCLQTANGDSAQVASCQRAFGKPQDRLYDYGVSFGGPLKRNKLFFFSSFERYTFANAGIGALSSTVPTMAFLNGDFSALLNKSVVLGTDNAGQTVYQGSIINPATGDVFPGNMIPSGDISQVSQRIVNLYKQYYQPLSSGLTNNNALPANSPATWYESDELSLKLDYNASASHRVDGSFIYAYTPRLLSNQGGIWSAGSTDGGPMANAYDHNTKAPSARARDSWTLSSTRLNVFSVTFNRFYVPSIARSQQGNWPEALGLGDFGAGNFPIIEFQGLNGTGQRFVNGQPIDEGNLGSQFNDEYAANTIIFDDTLSWVRGRHTYRFGGEFRIQQINSDGDRGVPTFIFDPAQTAGNFGAGFGPCLMLNECAGFGFASFLLGDVNQASVSEPNNTYGRRKSVSLFAEDDIRVTRRFTLNVDVRWDFNGRYHEKYGHWSNFDTSVINPVTGLPGALEFANSGSASFEKKEYYHNFSGFIGGAYQLTAKTVARASFGVYYVPLNLNTYSGVPYGFDPGFVLSNRVQTPFGWDSGYPGHAVNIGQSPNYTQYGMVSIDPRMLELGNIQAWTVGVQREITRDLAISANFLQNHGYHLESGYIPENQPNLAAYTAVAQAGGLYNTVTVPGAGGLPGFTGPAWQALAPYPSVAATYGPLFFVGAPLGNSDYQSLQLTVQKRSAHGLSVMGSYNLSSCHGDVDTAFEDLFYAGPLQNVYNLPQERHTICSFDERQVAKGFVLYELPFGRGKPLLSDAGPGLNALLGGWTVVGDFHYNTGMPMRIVANTFYPGINNVYSDILTGCNYSEHYNGQVGGTYFNPACFVNPPFGAFGDAPGYLAGLRNPGLAVEDLAMNKSVGFKDGRYRLHMYFQVFNVFNRHGFAGPNTQIGTAGFGTVLPQDLNGLPGPRVGQFGTRFSF